MQNDSGNLGDLLSWLEQCETPTQHDHRQLKSISSNLETLLKTGPTDAAESILRKLATAAGKDAEWRKALNDYGILESAILQMSLERYQDNQSLVNQCLRVIGNSVIDDDRNRALVTQNLGMLRDYLNGRDLAGTELAVMMNLCNDYEPAQKAAAEIRLDQTLAKFLYNHQVPEELADCAVDLLVWTTDCLTPEQLSNGTHDVFEFILGTVRSRDCEDHQDDLMAVLLRHLGEESVRCECAQRPEMLAKVMELANAYDSHLTDDQVKRALTSLSNAQPEVIDDEEDFNIEMTVGLVNALSSISSTDEFVRAHPFTSQLAAEMKKAITAPQWRPKQVYSCIMLGNMATSDEASTHLVQVDAVHVSLRKTLSSSNDPAALYSALGLTRHLALPTTNRQTLVEADFVSVLGRLLGHDDASVRGEAAAILEKLTPEETAIRHMVSKSQYHERIHNEVSSSSSILEHAVTVALGPSKPLPSTAMKNAVIEIGRMIVGILRSLSRSELDPSTAKELSNAFFETPLVARPVARLVRQRFYATARSEGLLGLGMMAQSEAGAACVVQELKEDSGLLNAIEEFVVEQKTGDEKTNRDYQNALVLVSALRKNGISAMDEGMKRDVDALQSHLLGLWNS
ncbi:hypothetical protein M011DRAFT_469799 [Sporormia fimetaria CBS 119925]|uniref:ARM repeat-containing protein n=1 Tax=Sporormia fimetaria CBS 119925 TaxID=1340428 RepID=A0A6A6V5A4_9PLEO|nr:hypothetical protein M011DRAFT_469799 [Sporormia fimetaria CBS 119925]